MSTDIPTSEVGTPNENSLNPTREEIKQARKQINSTVEGWKMFSEFHITRKVVISILTLLVIPSLAFGAYQGYQYVQDIEKTLPDPEPTLTADREIAEPTKTLLELVMSLTPTQAPVAQKQAVLPTIPMAVPTLIPLPQSPAEQEAPTPTVTSIPPTATSTTIEPTEPAESLLLSSYCINELLLLEDNYSLQVDKERSRYEQEVQQIQNKHAANGTYFSSMFEKDLAQAEEDFQYNLAFLYNDYLSGVNQLNLLGCNITSVLTEITE